MDIYPRRIRSLNRLIIKAYAVLLLFLIVTSCEEKNVERLPKLELTKTQLDHVNLAIEGGTLSVKIESSYTLWKLRTKRATDGQNFIIEINPSFGGSEEQANLETEVEISYQANSDFVINRQVLLLEPLDEGADVLSDQSLTLTQNGQIGLPINVDVFPQWKVEARNFLNGPEGDFDEISVKDPTIVFYQGAYHLFYTGRDKNRWRLGYAIAETLPQLIDSEHYFMESLNGGSYFAAPQVFWFEPQSRWYLVYQSGLGATFSTSEDVFNPDSWAAGQSMGFGDGIDFWVISDGSRVYCFYSAQDGTQTIKRRSTSMDNFPLGWSEPDVVATETFEAVHVYKNEKDKHFYMIVEDITRHQELWESKNLYGNWVKLEEDWAHADDLEDLADHWTDQVSHIELIRSGINEYMEVGDLNQCQMLIQGVPNGSYGDYGNIPYDLGIIRNY